MNTPITILLTVLVFGFLILIHELGHYLFARIFRVAVNEFSVGMGPKLISRVSKKTGIEYSVRLFPIGGYVSMVGENGEEDCEGALCLKPKWQRAIVLFAGSMMNLIMGFIIMIIYVISVPVLGSTVVAQFKEGATSSSYGLQEGDKILAVEGRSVHIPYELTYTIAREGIDPIDLTVERDGKKIILEDVVFPTYPESGVAMGDLDFKVYRATKNFGTVCYHAYYQSITTVRVVWESLVDLIGGKYGLEAVSGPVGTASTIGEAASYGFSSFLMLFGLIAINLGIMNLLPFPALDGGRLLFLLIEAIRRRPLKPEFEGVINFVGMSLLVGLMIVVTFKDILGLF